MLLLAEHDYQVRDFIERGLKTGAEWVALGPSAMSCLDNLGIAYAIPEDFYSPDVFDEFCDQTHQQVEWLCDHLDERLLSFYPELKSSGMPPFRFHIFPLMMIFDAVRGRLFQLQKIFAAHRTHTIHIHNGPLLPLNSDDLLFTNAETLWGHVAALPGWTFHLEMFPDPSPRVVAGSARTGSLTQASIKRQIVKSVLLTSAARLLSLRDYRGVWNVLRKRETYLVVNAPYEWAYVLPRLSRDGRRILFVSEEYFQRDQTSETDPPQGSVESAGSNSEFTAYFDVDGINCYQLLKDRLNRIWQTSPQQFIIAAQTFKKLKHRHRISAVLRCSSASGIDHAINQSAKALGIPVFVWQHGAVSYCDRITQFRDYADLMTADYTFAYGAEVARAYAHYGKEFGARVMPVGAPSLDSIVARQGKADQETASGERKRILYATTNYMQNHWYSGWKPAFSDRKFSRDQECIANYLVTAARAGLAEVVVKLHPSNQYQEPAWAKSLANIKGTRVIKDEESFENLLEQSDLVVLDFPSTILLTSIATERPVFVLVYHWLFPDHARVMLKERAVVADDAPALVKELGDFMQSGVFHGNSSNTSFLKAYGTYINDQKSEQRAVEILGSVLGTAYGGSVPALTQNEFTR